MVSSLILFFLGFIYSYYFYKDSQKNFEVTVGVDDAFFNEKIMYYYVWNSGKSTIHKEDLINRSRCLEVHFDKGSPIEFARISDKTSTFFEVDISQNYDHVKIDFDFLRPDEGFTIMMKFKRKIRTQWLLEIKQKKDLIHFPKVIKARGSLSNLYMVQSFLGFASLCISVGTTFFMRRIDYANLNSLNDYINAILSFIVLGLLLYSIPNLLSKIRASRPPIELNLHYIPINTENNKFKNRIKNLRLKKLKKKKKR